MTNSFSQMQIMEAVRILKAMFYIYYYWIRVYIHSHLRISNIKSGINFIKGIRRSTPSNTNNISQVSNCWTMSSRTSHNSLFWDEMKLPKIAQEQGTDVNFLGFDKIQGFYFLLLFKSTHYCVGLFFTRSLHTTESNRRVKYINN